VRIVQPYEIDFDLARLFYIYYGKQCLSEEFVEQNDWLFKEKSFSDEEDILIHSMYFHTKENALSSMKYDLDKLEEENRLLKIQRDKAYKDLESKDKSYLEALIQERVREKLNETTI
jgi:hypothetical protein